MPAQKDTLDGAVQSIIYRNDDNGYAVISVETTEGTPVTAVGCLPYVAPGETLSCVGEWTNHPVHGEQFSIARVERWLPDTRDTIFAYLASGILRGIGTSTAGLIVEAFGESALEVIEQTPEKLSAIKGITDKRARQIGEAFAQQSGMRRLMELLAVHGILPQAAIGLMQSYGAAAINVITRNPYIMTQPDIGVEFPLADAMALGEGLEYDDPRRLQAAILYQLNYNMELGHVYLPCGKLLDSTMQLLGHEDRTQLGEALEQLLADGGVTCEDNPLMPLSRCYLTELHRAETFTAAFALAKGKYRPEHPSDLDTLLEEIEQDSGITYAPAQRQAVRLAAQSGLMLLTGGPGTGKTTIVKAVLALFSRMHLKFSLAAPTGRAAKRLSEVTGEPASTIHRLLEFGPDPMTNKLRFLRDAQNPLEAEVVVVDETSMVDLLLFYRLLQALKPSARLILVGDPDQLPPVGPGQVLEDLLHSGQPDVVRLTQIFRQGQESGIVMGAHSVNQGDIPSLRNEYKDFFFLKRPVIENTVAQLVELCTVGLPVKMGIDPAQIQVLTPTRKGSCGTAALNRILQEAMNPPADGKSEKTWGDTVFRLGDRVMQVRNNYNLVWLDEAGAELENVGVFNGEIGVITAIDFKAERVMVRFEDHWVSYPYESLTELVLAYALTVHKSQGSEYQAVLLVIQRAAPQLLARRVLYTAMTRAREYLICVGDPEVLGHMVANNKRGRRYSALQVRLEGAGL